MLLAFALTAFGMWQFGLLGQTTASNAPAEPQARQGESTIKVLTTPVRLRGDDRVFEAVGTGRSRLSIQVYPAVAEEIEEVLFEAGQLVEKGDLLVQLDNEEQKLAVRLAEVSLEDARRLRDRYQNAGERGAVPQSEVDAARAAFDTAEVELEQARLAVREREVRASFSGVVGLSNVDPGDRIDPSTPIGTLDDRAVLFVDYEIPEQLFSSLAGKSDNSIEVSTPAWPGRAFEGSFSAQESRMNPQRRTLMVRANIDNKDDALRPGMSFTIRWTITGEEYPTVPEICLQWGRDGSFVWAVRDGVAEKVMGRVVARSGGLVLLDAELEEGQAVVMEGVQRVRPGAAVEVVGELEG